MSAKRTDFRGLRARRDAALAARHPLTPPKPKPLDNALLAAAVAAGCYTRLASKRRKR